MKKHLKILSVVLLLAIGGGLVWHLAIANAAFNSGDIMDDGVFNNISSMDGPGIDSWLNANFPHSCISVNSGFSAPQPTGYSPSGGFTYGGNVSAGTVIYDAAHVYGLNPQVILATLEKESSVVSGNASYHCQYINTALGYGCLDSSACPVNPATESGFSKQVIHAAWLLKFAQQRSEGNLNWDVQVTNFPNPGDVWNNSDDPQSCYSGPMTQGTFTLCPGGSATYFDGLDTIDGQTVFISTGATAALYDYTPHFPGNENFDSIFTSWFGSIYGQPYQAQQYAQSAYPQLNPGQSTNAYIEFQNDGTYAWYDDNSFSSSPPGEVPVHLATAHPLNRTSLFDYAWPTTSRPTFNFAAVYNSDGTTLAGSQNIVEPGQIAKFVFPITAPGNLAPGTYTEFFQPVADGVGNGGFNDVSTFFNVTVNGVPGVTAYDHSASPTINPGTQATASVRVQNTGNIALYDDNSLGSAPSGTNPVHLATDASLNRASAFSSGWPTSSRPDLNFSAVYNSDGTTLASNQDVAQPGQIIAFRFPISVPSDYAAGTYQEAFTPILEGTGNGFFPDEDTNFTVTVPSTPSVSYSTTPATVTMNANQRQTINLTITNSGNATLPSTTKIYSSSGSTFQDSSWVSNTIIASSIGSALSPGQSATIPITVLAPDTSSTITPTLDIEFQQSNGTPIPSAGSLALNTTINSAQYSVGNVKQSSYPALTYGQTATMNFYYQNTGNQIWYDDNSLSSATTRDPHAVHLATASPLNRASGFDDNWPSSSRPAVTFTAVYNSDGVTLASNQHVVQPGQIVEFQFQVTPSVSLSPAVYREFFRPIAEGTADGAFNFPWTFDDITLVAPTYVAAQVSQSSYPTLSRGQQVQSYIEFQNNGTIPWYDDTSIAQAPSNAYPVHLGTSHSLNRSSIFSSGWPTSSRPNVNFAAVYDSDGVTPASSQHIVQPGQIAKFSFTLTAPSNASSGSYREFFQPVAEGTADGAFNDVWTSTVVTVP
jgi:hypothetical protein